MQFGLKFGDKYQILSGLNEGDEVAESGGFLIDSESQLKSGMQTGHQHEDSNQLNDKELDKQDSEEHNNQ